MVDRQMARLNTAVLARIVIAAKDRPARQRHSGPRSPDLACQPDNRRSRELRRRSANITPAVDDDFGFAADQ
jgi:hypothetical protein